PLEPASRYARYSRHRDTASNPRPESDGAAQIVLPGAKLACEQKKGAHVNRVPAETAGPSLRPWQSSALALRRELLRAHEDHEGPPSARSRLLAYHPRRAYRRRQGFSFTYPQHPKLFPDLA